MTAHVKVAAIGADSLVIQQIGNIGCFLFEIIMAYIAESVVYSEKTLRKENAGNYSFIYEMNVLF